MGVELHSVTVWYPGAREPAVEGVSLRLEPGECVALTGPNGGGKTTILRVASGAIPRIVPARVEGVVRVDGLDPARAGLARLLQHLGQDPKTQVVGPTGLLEAAAAPLFAGMERGEVLRRALEALRSVGAEGLAHRSTANLSGGELERVAIAGVTSIGPRYLLLDEPTSMLDEDGRRAVERLVSSWRRRGGVLLATHDPGLAGSCDRSYIVRRRLEEGVYRERLEPPPRPSPTGGAAAVLEGVSFSYPGGRTVLRGASIRVDRGGLTVFTGPNGSGKTTLLLILAGLLKPQAGRVRVEERPALLPQDPLLVFSRATLREELGGRVPEWAGDVADRPVLSLSGGGLRLAALALVASSGRRLLLLDEPTSGLDPRNRARIARVLAGLAGEGYAVAAATHDPILVAAASRVYRLGGGRAWLEYSASSG